jgi:CRP/FNR family transcriptional regulator, cyclic AMP receptor protein
VAEDPLTYLPRKSAQEVAKGTVIYGQNSTDDRLYVVIVGRVRVNHAAADGSQTIGRIVRADGLFGESALSGRPLRSESAVAMDDVTLMSWTRAEVEQHIEREPKLGLALCQSLVRQGLELQDRIESMAVYKTPERVMHALLQLAGELGTPMPDGTVRIASLTHHTVAEYVGTSREIVTFQMNRLRRLGLIRYSRQFIDVHPKALREALAEAPAAAEEVGQA